MKGEAKHKIALRIAECCDRASHAPVAEKAAADILAIFRDALLSEGAVVAAGMGLTGARWDNGHKLVSGEKLSAREMARVEARAALVAALDSIGGDHVACQPTVVDQ